MKALLQRLQRGRNPHNETRLHLAKLVRRHGFSVGAHSYGRPKVRFAEGGAHLTIGRYCSVADQVEILLGGNHRIDHATTYPFAALPGLWPGQKQSGESHASKGDVVIGHDVWLGSGCMILSGVTIGHGAVIGAKAVVARDVPPYGVFVGNPGRVIRFRFEEPTIAALLEAAWWDLPREDVEALIPLLQSERIEELLAAVAARRARAS